MSYYDAPRGKAAEVKSLDPETFARLARQTDIVAGDGAAGSKGKWTLLAGSAASQEAALEIYDQARMPASPRVSARARWKTVAGATKWRSAGYASAAEAEVAAARLKAATELKPTVVRCAGFSPGSARQLLTPAAYRSTRVQPRALSAEASCIACIETAQNLAWARAHGRQPNDAASARSDSAAASCSRRSTASLK
jgi:hypothetical protein